MKKGGLIIFALAISILCKAEVLHLTPGTLGETLGDNVTSVSELVLTGEADARDLFFVASLPALKSLDLSGLKIVEVQSRTPIANSRCDFPSDVIPAFCFSLSKVEKIILPESVTKIEECAFASSALKEITLGVNLRHIADWSFYNSKIALVNLPATVDSLGQGIFADCHDLKEVNMSAMTLTRLPAATFRGCESLKQMNFPKGITILGNESFLGSGMESLQLPSAMEKVEDYALSSMPSLREVVTAANVDFGDGVMYNNPTLSKFVGQRNLSFLSLAETPLLRLDSAYTTLIESIGDYALAGNGSVVLYFAPTLASVGRNVFDGMANLNTVNVWKMKGAVPETADGAFNGLNNVSNTNLRIEREYQDLWSNHPEWGQFRIVLTTNSVESVPDADNGIVCTLDGLELTLLATESLTNVKVYSSDGTLLTAAIPGDYIFKMNLYDVQGKIIIVQASTSTITKSFKLRP